MTDADLRALVSDEVFQPEVVWKLLDLQVFLDSVFPLLGSRLSFSLGYDLIFIILKGKFSPNNLNLPQVTCGTLGLSTATVKLVDADGMEHIACSVGTGPVDSAYKAVDLIVKV